MTNERATEIVAELDRMYLKIKEYREEVAADTYHAEAKDVNRFALIAMGKLETAGDAVASAAICLQTAYDSRHKWSWTIDAEVKG